MRYSIKRKLQIVFLLFILLGAINTVIFYIYSTRIRTYQNTLVKVDKLRILTLEARKFENDFLTFDTRNNDFMQSGVSRNLIQYGHTMNDLKMVLTELKDEPLIQSIGFGYEMEEIKLANEECSKLFTNLSQWVKERGFKDYGLEGEMRTAIHQLENGSSISKEKILMLRRHEKDFFLRKDTAYVNRLTETAQLIQSNTVNERDKQLLTAYLTLFNRIVGTEKRIGLTEQTGDRGRIFALMQEMDVKVSKLHQLISNSTKNLVQESWLIIAVSSLCLLVLAAVFGFGFAYRLSKPIIMLDNVAKSVVREGLIDQDVMLDAIDTRDEIGNLARDFKSMLSQLKKHIHEIDSQNEQLKLTAEEESKRNWRNEGLSKIADILRQPDGLVSKLSEAIFTTVRHLEALQGSVYVLEEVFNTQVMEMKAYFASNKLENKSFRYGEGFIGEAWRKKEHILLKDIQIPDLSTRIVSRLGYAAPKTVLIIPMMVEEHVLGVMEISSLNDLAEYQIDFIKRECQQIAMHLVLIKLSEQNRKLVDTLNEHQISFPTPEFIAGATHDEIMEMLRKQQ